MADDSLRTLGHAFDWRADSLDWPLTTDVGPGLAGVIAGETRVMWLEPSSGLLSYRGIPIESLAESADFEEVAYLLIAGTTADEDPEAFRRFSRDVRGSRRLPDDVVALIRELDPQTHPTRLLRAGVSALGCHELDVDDDQAGEHQWRELRIVGQVAALVAEIARHRRRQPPAVSDDDESLAEAVLAALTDRRPSADEARALDLAWVLYAAHGLDAPTFTSMVVASCLADPYTNVVAGLSALRGPRLGGASERVVEQLLELPEPSAAEDWVRDTIAEGGRIAGFGHRVYRMADPRVVPLRKAVASLARSQGRSEVYEAARAIEAAAVPALVAKGAFININFYGATLYHLLGADPQLCPCLIAVARTAGLLALVRESLDHIRLFRPLSRSTTERRHVDRESAR